MQPCASSTWLAPRWCRVRSRPGSPDEAPFDAILLNGAVPEVPQALLDQLKDGGRLVAIVASSGYGRVQVWRRTGRSFGNLTAFDAAADALPGFAREPGFVF